MPIIEDFSRRLILKMEKKNFRNVKSLTGLVETSCNIVEESYRRLKKQSDGLEKKKTAVNLLRPLLEKMRDEDVLTVTAVELLEKQIESSNVEDTVDDIVEGWNRRMEGVMTCCFKIKKIARVVTELERIVID